MPSAPLGTPGTIARALKRVWWLALVVVGTAFVPMGAGESGTPCGRAGASFPAEHRMGRQAVPRPVAWFGDPPQTPLGVSPRRGVPRAADDLRPDPLLSLTSDGVHASAALGERGGTDQGRAAEADGARAREIRGPPRRGLLSWLTL